MGNCQAVDAAALVIQHPTGKIERMYSPILASEVMKLNPGHYVSLIIPLPVAAATGDGNSDDKTAVRFTRVKLLRPNDTLVLGRAYRLVTTQDVMKVLRAKKYAKMKKKQQQQEAEMSEEKLQADAEEHSSTSQLLEPGNSDLDKAVKNERQRRGGGLTSTAAAGGSRSKSWRHSLDSISESGS
nr:endoglucanase 12 [Ipomoea batatas]